MSRASLSTEVVPITGSVLQNLEDVRATVAEFVERNNQSWRLEKLAHQTPTETPEEYELSQAD